MLTQAVIELILAPRFCAKCFICMISAGNVGVRAHHAPLPTSLLQFQRRHRDQRNRGQSNSFIVDKSGIWKAWFTSLAKICLLLSQNSTPPPTTGRA